MSLNVNTLSHSTTYVLLTLFLVTTACNRADKSSVRTFANPEEVGNSLQAAAKSGNQATLWEMFGPDAKEIISSGDAVQDKNAVNTFAEAYEVMHRWRTMADGAQTLIVGTDNFPFPIPLKKNKHGQWFFDTNAGKEEILNRRVGRNELAIIDVCQAVAEAQAEYFSKVREGETKKEYALKFISDPGEENGLYWESQAGQPESPLGPLVAFAAAEGYSAKPNAHVPFHGYYFHMLQGQTNHAPGGAKDYVVDGKMLGGFAFVAYPAEYGNSGVMTFMINQDGVLLQKDLGNNTRETATSMSLFDPDSTWTIVQQ
jgi:hypothetical protein